MPWPRPPLPKLGAAMAAIRSTAVRPRGRRLPIVAIVATLATLVVAPPAEASFAHFERGVLSASGGEGKLVPRCDRNGFANVSGYRPDNGREIDCGRVREIVLKGTGAPDTIDLTFAEHSDFSGLKLVRGYGRGGSDKMIGASAARNELFGGAASDSVTGGRLGDALYGGSGSDRLIGLGGPDRLFGGPGGDSLSGGPGRDTERQ
jgi:hypothetical protein